MEEIAKDIVRLLTKRKKTLALAESRTGGFIANQITNVPGASKIFLGGIVSYSNEAKQKFLGVRAKTLEQHGAVSEAYRPRNGSRRAQTFWRRFYHCGDGHCRARRRNKK